VLYNTLAIPEILISVHDVPEAKLGQMQSE
jgi:hypothetical protein